MLNPPFLPDFFNAFPGLGPTRSAPSDFRCSRYPAKNCGRRTRNIQPDVQHQLPGKALLEFGLRRTSGTKLPRFRQMNQASSPRRRLISSLPTAQPG